MEACPYGDLHIYYLQGRCPADEEETLGACYLGNWEEESCSFLFFTAPADRRVERLLQAHTHLTLLDRFCIPYKDWQQDFSRPLCIGRLHITAPWTDGACPDDALVLRLDPGVVFGSGVHPTTRDCLAALQEVFEEAAPQTVLDLGTGTGVLALAAARLGAEEVLAVDCNPLAVKTARKNVCLNGFGDRVRVVKGRAEDFLDSPAQLLIANIHWEIMDKLLRDRRFLDNKRFILSGLMRSEARRAEDLLEELPVRVRETREHENTWHTLWGEVTR